MRHLFNNSYSTIIRIAVLIIVLFNTVFIYGKQINDGDGPKSKLTVTSKIVVVNKGTIRSIHKGTHSLSEVCIKENQILEIGDDIATVMVLKYGSEEERAVYLNENRRLLLLLEDQLEAFKNTNSSSNEAQMKHIHQSLDSLKNKYEKLQEYLIKHRGKPAIVTNILMKKGDRIKQGDIIAEIIDIGVILPKGTIDEEYYRNKLDDYDVIASIRGNNIVEQEISISDLLYKRDTSNVWASHGKPSVGEFVINLDKVDISFLDQIVEIQLLLKKK
ncbi:hypothetical protein HX057_07385 [Myroides odoratimimus]|nr:MULTISPECIES: hypothetical protein [Myroides]AJA70003.1 hypothetical protein MYRA21_2894 [Myroides sp. A21]EHO08415.1 hypothetical protein HMPREF9712_02077 [Myroides odoratimimus CCUG 10230]MCA4792365.1 hypothetical protein [Myroides odoratimimus]MCA4807051.1 hypothetical protein [Myroides odoratimimus]MCO7722789.1 hypothetical protein [Myroides odoratimimus]